MIELDASTDLIIMMIHNINTVQLLEKENSVNLNLDKLENFVYLLGRCLFSFDLRK